MSVAGGPLTVLARSATTGAALAQVEVLPDDSLAQLRQAVALASGLANPARLLQGTRVLSGSSTVESAGLADGSQLEVVRGAGVLATTSTDSTAKLWCTRTGECQMTLYGHDDQVMYISFSRDGQLIATSSTDRTARIWCGDSGECLRILEGHTGPVYVACFSPDSRQLATASHDRSVKLWKVNSGFCDYHQRARPGGPLRELLAGR